MSESSEEDVRRDFPIRGDVPGWFFRVREVSMGHYQVEGRDLAGSSVSRHGGDPDALLKRCQDDARSVRKR